MTTRYVTLAVLLVAVVVLASGCTSPVQIVAPKLGRSHDPVTHVDLLFTSKFKPASDVWSLTLNKVAVLGFAPAAAPGVTARAPLPTVPTLQNNHVLELRVTCGGICAYDTQTLTYHLPVLSFNNNEPFNDPPVTLIQYVLTEVIVGVEFAPTVPIPVTVVEDLTGQAGARLRIGGTAADLRPPGSTVIVTIPAGQNRARFYIEGQTLGSYSLLLSSAGVFSARGTGDVAERR